MNLDDRKLLIKSARSAISAFFDGGQDVEPCDLNWDGGVFVNIIQDGKVRSSLGMPELKRSLGEAVLKLVKMAAFGVDDNLKKNDLESVKIEICLLKKPVLISVKSHNEYKNKIEIGKHGLIVECEDIRDLLLPRVATDNQLDVEMYLDSLCEKAGLLTDTWKEIQACKIYKFEVESFGE